MLNSLKITNFQSHSNTEIDFDPRLTVLVGPSNNGKTAIIRAITVKSNPRVSPFGSAYNE